MVDIPGLTVRFFASCREKIVSERLSSEKATESLSTVVGALAVANALRDAAAYDRVTEGLMSSA